MAAKANGLKKRQEISSANRTMLIWVVAASMAVSVFLVAAQFLYQQFAYNWRVLDAKAKASKNLTTNISNVKALDSDIKNKLESNRQFYSSEKVLNALPTELNDSSFGASLQQFIVPRTGASLESVAIDNSNNEGDATAESTDSSPTPKPVSVAATVSGSYEQITAFVRNLELSIRPVKVERMNISGSDANTRATVEMTTYYQPKKGVTITTKAQQ